MVLTSRWPPLSTTAYTLPATRLLTNSVPLSPQVIARALLSPCAHRDTLKPRGTLILSTRISPGALGAGGWAMGASGELAILGGAWAKAEDARVRASKTASDVEMNGRMVGPPL